MGKFLLDQERSMGVISMFLHVNLINFDQKSVILLILENTKKKDQTNTATRVVDMCLSQLSENKQKSFFSTDTLSLALTVAEEYSIARATAENLVRVAAEMGFHGRFPELPRRLLGRDMNGDEVIALISSYVNNKATRTQQSEEEYKIWAKRYLPKDKAEVQIARINAFARAWKLEIDL